MKKDKLLLFAALAAIGYGLWKLLGQSTKPKATANSTLKTTGSGITPGFFPGFTAPGGSTGKAPTGGPSEGGKQGGGLVGDEAHGGAPFYFTRTQRSSMVSLGHCTRLTFFCIAHVSVRR